MVAMRNIIATLCLTFAVLLFLFLVLPIFFNAPASASDCSKKAQKQAESRGNYYTPEGARAFGLKVQEFVKANDLAGIFSLVDGELQHGPRKKFIADKSFDEIFDKSWRISVLTHEPDCSPVGWRGFMLGNGKVWYNKSKKGWNIFSINGATVESATIKSVGWTVDEKTMHPLCFIRPWMSGDNFEEFAEFYEIDDLQEMFRAPGQFMGEKISNYEPIKPSWCSDDGECETISLVGELNQCTPETFEFEDRDGSVWIKVSTDDGDIEYEYKVLKEFDAKKCSKLAPGIGVDCQESYLVSIGDYSGGSMGWDTSYGIYGLFDLPNLGPSIVPLIFFQSKNDALNYLDQINVKETYKDDKEDGSEESYYDNGQLREKGTYKDGKKEGFWESYYDNGQLHYEGTYKDGKKEGSWEFYDKNGQLKE